jgi:coproporphyrinogen III oxidase-like Fe-S oxidoreductase
VPRLGDYLASDGYSPIAELETPDAARGLRERIMMGVRLAEGLDSPAILAMAAAVNPDAPSRLHDAVAALVRRRLLQAAADRWTLTDTGFLMTDGVAAELMACI